LRNAVAHADYVDRNKLRELTRALAAIDLEESEPVLAMGPPSVDYLKSYDAASRRLEVLGGGAFRVHAWRDEPLEQEMIANGFVAIGGSEVDDLTRVSGDEEVRRLLTESIGPYHYVDHVDPHARHRRAVSWDAINVDRDAFGTDLRKVLSGRHTIQDIKTSDAVRRLRALVSTGVDPGP
jgi:hypothetical protein